MENYFVLLIGAVLVNNFVLAKFLGVCPFLGVSKNVKTAMGMSGAVIFVMTIGSALAAVIHHYVLLPKEIGGVVVNPHVWVAIDLTYLRTISFILVIASNVQLLEVVLQRLSQPLYQGLGIFLPLITTNCAVLGAAVINAQKEHSIIESTWYGFASGLGFALALILFSSLRERLDIGHPPKSFQGVPIALITAGIAAMIFMGFSGLDIGLKTFFNHIKQGLL